MATMKKLLLTGIAVLLLATATARADPLPDSYVGRWCWNGNFYEMVRTEEECHHDDPYMEITRHGWTRHWTGHDDSCKFVSIRYTGEKMPMSTQPREEDWVPVVRIFARCYVKEAGGVIILTFRERITFRYLKGAWLSIDEIQSRK
jgi:hypothetical protein